MVLPDNAADAEEAFIASDRGENRIDLSAKCAIVREIRSERLALAYRDVRRFLGVWV